ncbi:hypothetical protein LCGC14_1420850 [marine sediment metagenome]|uniref:Porin domain-containing protein n=1 Tax=marine sediment metagenome TaxID=412755 RepID=A0A0F9MT41_9ZZZZ|nr:hypothetical protein [Candidatus Scalindua sp.]
MKSKKACLFLPLFAAFAIFAGSMLYADVDVVAEGGRAKAAAGIDREALKAEIMEELRAEMLSTARAEIQSAAVPEVSQAAISSAVSSALEESGILAGMFKGTTIGGFIDTNYLYNLRNHGEGAGGGGNRNASLINFVGENEDNSFVLENFALFMDKEATDEHPIGWQMHTYWGEKAQGITFFGPGNDASASSVGNTAGNGGVEGFNDRFAIATANITWNAPVFGRTVPITMGKMYTWIGYELVENIGNPNYTHGAVYNNVIPFTHMGMSFDVSEFLPSDKWGLTLYAVNGWDSYIDNNEGKSFGGYLTYAPNDDFFISLAVINGPETPMTSTDASNTGFGGDNESDKVFMYDIVITYALPQVDKLSLGFNWDHGRAEDAHVADNGVGRSSAHWWAAVGYAMYDFTDNQQGALRYEYFDDTDAAKAFDISMWTLTYTHNITIADNLMIRPEIRYNSYSDNTSTTSGTIGSLTPGDKGNDADSETIIGLGVEYVF